MVLNYTIFIHSILTVISGHILMVKSGHCPRDDRLHRWSLQRQGLHTGEAQKYCGLSESRSSFWPERPTLSQSWTWPLEHWSDHPVKRMVWTLAVPYCVPNMGERKLMKTCSQYGFQSCDGNSEQKWNKISRWDVFNLIKSGRYSTLTFVLFGFAQVEVKPEMIGHYLGEFSISYKPVSLLILIFLFSGFKSFPLDLWST